MNWSNRFSRSLILGVGLILTLQGCAMMEANRKQKAERLEKIERQKETYFSLKKDLEEKKVKVGTTEAEIKEKYGAPDNIFGNASGVSNFALWFYEYPDTEKEESYNPVRLYFNDKKLSYWSD